MIESNIVQWVDLGDSMQSLEVYSNKKITYFFNLIKVLINFKKFSVFFYIILKCFYFLQIVMLSLTNLTDESDSAIKILKYISTVIFVQEIIIDSTTYKVAVILTTIITFISILCFIFLIISVSLKKIFIKIPIILFNLINILLLNYFIGPIVQISILSTNCQGGLHKYLQTSCYSDTTHIIIFIISFINLIVFVSWSILLSIYYNEIGSINETKVLARMNTNYEFCSNLSKISMFIFAYFIKFNAVDNSNLRLIFKIFMMLNCLGFAIYVYKSVFFYDSRINATILYGWIFVSWFSIVILIKKILNINDTSIFHVLGWIIVSAIVFTMEELKGENLLTDFNIFESKSLKEIELFNVKLFNLMTLRSVKNKTLLVGIVKKFEDLVKANEDIKEKFYQLSTNQYLMKKFNSVNAVGILSMIYIIYEHYLDKSLFKNEILFNFCYFLINRLKNVTYAIYLCSKIKATTHKHIYLKYLLMEEIKDYMINKLSKSNNKESFKHIQIGSVLLYNTYADMFKFKIYESACMQVDYFDLLRNNVTTPNTTENFLKIGEKVLTLRKEIMRLWERIVELNCLNEEAFKDYSVYLREILQDDALLRNETKKFNNIRSTKFAERNNLYNQLFNPNSAIALVDGYASFGKILYTTQNFPGLYYFSGKELLNLTIDDLCPGVVKDFHREIIDNTIRYSNLNSLFNSQRDLLLKGKTGNLHNVKIFIKPIPNLSYGLIYILNVTKILDNSYIIILDKDFRINAFTDIFSLVKFSSSSGFALDRNIVNSYIATILPDFLTQLVYSEVEGMFFIENKNKDLKGTLYTVAPHRSLNEKVDKVLDQIKLNGKLNLDQDSYQDAMQEYEELVREISSKATAKHSIFFRIVSRVFMNKYRYFRIYISTDLISIEENTNTNNTGLVSKNGILNAANRELIRKRREAANLPGNTASQNKTFNETQNGIKIKIKAFNSGEEGNNLIEEENEEIKAQPDLFAMEKRGKKPGEDSSLKSGSAYSSGSVDSASFNKLKNGILEKKEVSVIRYMKYLSYVFGIGTILLVYFSSESSNTRFANLNNYLLQNLYFNHSKISVSCVYLATQNLKLLKNKIYNETRCLPSCSNFYSKTLETCISDLKTEKENSTTFFEDFKSILSRQKEITLNLFNFTEKDSFTVDIENNINLIISYGLKLDNELQEYLKNSKSLMDVVVQNILEQTILYINDEKISGFGETPKAINFQSTEFSPLNLSLIIEGTLFSILLILFINFIFRLFNLENFYLQRLVKFKNLPFEIYLKSLDEIKKRMRNDNQEEEEEKLENDMDLQDMGNQSKHSKGENSNKNYSRANTNGENNKDNNAYSKRKRNRKKRSDSKDGDDERKRSGKRKKGASKDGEKDNTDNAGKNGKSSLNIHKKNSKKRVKNYQEEKIEIMGRYFLKWNLFFCIKVIVILLLSASYYLVVSLIDNNTLTSMLSFDSTTNSIEGVYKESFLIYFNLKKELASYADFELLKQATARSFDLNPNATVNFNGNQFSSKAQLLFYASYKMNLPLQLNTPKIGTLLMPIINTDLTEASDTINNLNNLYNLDACSVIFSKEIEVAEYSLCARFWSSILLKGMEQSITQMSVVITSVLDDLHSLNQNSKNLYQVLAEGSTFNNYEQFVELYLFRSYMRTVLIFRKLNQINLDFIYNTYRSIMIGYICFVFILFWLLYYFVHKSKYIFNTFMNFIGILPVKFLLEDPALYKEILRLERFIY